MKYLCLAKGCVAASQDGYPFCPWHVNRLHSHVRFMLQTLYPGNEAPESHHYHHWRGWADLAILQFGVVDRTLTPDELMKCLKENGWLEQWTNHHPER